MDLDFILENVKKYRKTQNSRVLSQGDNNSLDKECYSMLTGTFVLYYVGGKWVTLFKYEWYNV